MQLYICMFYNVYLFFDLFYCFVNFNVKNFIIIISDLCICILMY
jgi:hypothetical protein